MDEPLTPVKGKPNLRDLYNDEQEDEGDVDAGAEPSIWPGEDIVLGPTPQKYGKVVGLFDVASPDKHQSVKKRKHPTDEFNIINSTPSAKIMATLNPLDTPSYLRKKSVTHNATPKRLFSKPPTRGLSTIISELRQFEDDEEDDGLGVMREMELAELRDSSSSIPKDEPEGLSEQREERVRWKKKGQKRSRRRVVMKPSKATSKPDLPQEQESDSAAEHSECTRSEENAEEIKMGPAASSTQATATAVIKEKPKLKKGPKQVSQNFKSLKLRNTGAKGPSRFGRGRFGKR